MAGRPSWDLRAARPNPLGDAGPGPVLSRGPGRNRHAHNPGRPWPLLCSMSLEHSGGIPDICTEFTPVGNFLPLSLPKGRLSGIATPARANLPRFERGQTSAGLRQQAAPSNTERFHATHAPWHLEYIIGRGNQGQHPRPSRHPAARVDRLSQISAPYSRR